LIKGKGDLIITGQVGEVMQESARAALSYTRAYLDAQRRKGIHEFDNLDIHIHVPAGAIPKDGPSAGTAMATALNLHRHPAPRGQRCGHDRGNYLARAASYPLAALRKRR
jgi:ATP-dependent Lon protease